MLLLGWMSCQWMDPLVAHVRCVNFHISSQGTTYSIYLSAEDAEQPNAVPLTIYNEPPGDVLAEKISTHLHTSTKDPGETTTTTTEDKSGCWLANVRSNDDVVLNVICWVAVDGRWCLVCLQIGTEEEGEEAMPLSNVQRPTAAAASEFSFPPST